MTSSVVSSSSGVTRSGRFQRCRAARTTRRRRPGHRASLSVMPPGAEAGSRAMQISCPARAPSGLVASACVCVAVEDIPVPPGAHGDRARARQGSGFHLGQSRCAAAQLLCCTPELPCNGACNFHGRWHMRWNGLLSVQAEPGVADSRPGHRQGALGADWARLGEARTGLGDGQTQPDRSVPSA